MTRNSTSSNQTQSNEQTTAIRGATAASTGRAIPRKSRKQIDEELYNLIAGLREEITALKTKIATLERGSSSPRNNQSLRTTNDAAKETEERERRSKNVIVRGIKPSTAEDDETQVNTFLGAVCEGDVKAVKVHRIRTATQNSTLQNNRSPPAPAILVTLENSEVQQKVLKSARHHHVTAFDQVFALPDRTKAQQFQYSENAKVAQRKNDKLQKSGKLDQPFRFVVRGDRVRCIDFIQSSTNKTSVYATEQQIRELFAYNYKPVDHALASGAISNQRASMRSDSTTAATPSTSQAVQE